MRTRKLPAAPTGESKAAAPPEQPAAHGTRKPPGRPPARDHRDLSQQFDIAKQIIAAGLVPIIEPEVDIHCLDKAKAEQLLKAALIEGLNALPMGRLVMLKLTLPEQDDFYADFVNHSNVVRVVALSGGYTREQANDRLRRNHGVVASFSRALVEGLSVQQSDEQFNTLLDASIQSIYDASNTKVGAAVRQR